MRILTLDCETTGLPPKGANYEVDYMEFPRIVSFAYKINGDKTKHFIINQEGRPIPPEATAINKITDEMASASPYKFIDVILMMLQDSIDLTDVTIGHNLYFDSSMVKANVLRLVWEGKIGQVVYDDLCIILHKDRRICTMMKTVKYCGKWPKLTELYFKLFGETFDAHSADADVDATYRCFIELLERKLIVIEPKKSLDLNISSAILSETNQQPNSEGL